MTPEEDSLTDQRAIQIVEQFALEHGFTFDGALKMGIRGMARCILTTGTLSLPLQIGPPSTYCHTCPIAAQFPHHLPTNVHPGPWLARGHRIQPQG